MTQVAAIPLDTSDEMFPKIVAILEDFLDGFDTEFDGEITRQTTVLADLGFESIDIIQLGVALEAEIGKRAVPFEKLLMNNGRYVDDLEVGQTLHFVSH